MKAKKLIWIALVLQFGFLFSVLFLAPEQIGAIKIGLEKLREICPVAAPFSPSDSGIVKLVTAGDWFLAASGGIKFLTTVTFFVVALNIVLLIFVLCLLRTGGERSPR